MRILITGARGRVGDKLTRRLEGAHELRLFDITPSEDPRSILGDITDLRSVLPATRDMDAFIHLAIASGHEGDYEDDDFNDRRFHVHVNGSFHVLEAARRCGVKRVVYASSLMVVWGYGPAEFVGPGAPARPVGTYALTKYLGEVLCEQYARQHGLSIVCVRMARPIDPDDPDDRFAQQSEIRPQWIHIDDLCRAFQLAAEVDGLGFEIIHLVGESSQRRWDLSAAERLLGYRPRWRLEEKYVMREA